MKVFTWNCTGAKRCPVCDFLEFLLVLDSPDLILLQEIHADEVRSKVVIRSLGQCQDSFAQSVAGASRGIISAWHTTMVQV